MGRCEYIRIQYKLVCLSHQMLVLLNFTLSDEMKQEGIAREVVNKIQKLRKKVNDHDGYHLSSYSVDTLITILVAFLGI